MMQRRFIPILFLCLPHWSACDDDESGPGDVAGDAADAGAEADGEIDAMPDSDDASDAGDTDAGPTWTADAVCEALSERICAALSACDCRFDVRAYDEAGCVAARTEACQATFGARIEPDLEDGLVRFDPPTIDACFAGIDALAVTCELVHESASPLPAACDRMVLATAGDGEDCGIAGIALCADGAGVCLPGESGSTCTALPGDGEDCLGSFCADGLVCHGPVGEDPPQCGPPHAADGPCGDDTNCEAGLICPPANTCAAPGGDGADCHDELDCAEGLWCDVGTCAEATPLGEGCRGPGVCGAGAACGRAPESRTCETPHGEGDACEPGSCAAGLGCEATSGLCAVLPIADQPCLDGDTACAPGLGCAFSSGTCVALPEADEPCFTDGNAFCAPGFGCRESDQTCQPASVATDGEPCLLNPPDYICADGLGCDFGANGSICIEMGGQGDPCNSDRTCGVGFYCEFSTLSCEARLDDGSVCADANECQIGSECQIRAGVPSCAAVPAEGDPCFAACSDGLTCQGPGGECVPELCILP